MADIDKELSQERDVFAELARVKSKPTMLKIESGGRAPSQKDGVVEEAEGQLIVDVFQDNDTIYVQSVVAGVNPDDLDLTITKESVTIRGKRERIHAVSEKDFFYQECFWGRFSRSIVLPQEVDAERSSASLKNGVLTIAMPKLDRSRGKSIKVKQEDE